MLAALLLVLLAGAMNGSFATPMKRVRGWEWENTWLLWSFLGMIVIPLIVAAMTISNLKAVYCMAGLGPLMRTALYGMLRGASAVLFGLGITRVGLALGFGIILGTSSSLGAVVPLIRMHRDQLLASAGLLTLAGVAIILGGVAACARAGILRDTMGHQQQSQGAFTSGLIICVLSGIGSSFMSVALNDSTLIFRAAQSSGASPTNSFNAEWPVLLGGGFAVNAAYCVFCLIRRHTVLRFTDTAGINLGLVLAMAVLWSGSNFVYGAGARRMGSLGLVLGWPVFMAAIVLTANAWGTLTGEWRGVSRRAVTWTVVGNLLLVAGISVVALA
jgi:L-rhamnose-H+ transport protein